MAPWLAHASLYASLLLLTAPFSGPYFSRAKTPRNSFRPHFRKALIHSERIRKVIQRDFQSPATGTGTLTVHLKPDNLAGTQWRFSGETDWRDGEVEISGLVPGTYLVESKPVADRVTPPTTSVAIEEGVPSSLTLTYVYANNPTGEGTVVLSFENVSNDEDQPFAYLGQIRSSVGSSTGFVVKRR